MLKVLDLFSGIGGFSLGLERTGGFETVAFCENAEYPRAVLKNHWPDIYIHNDVKTLDYGRFGEDTDDWILYDKEADHEITRGPIQLICAGYPCQPFSNCGKRGGENDDRHLWPEVARLLRSIRPCWAIFENVSGHVTMGLDSVLSDLEAIGYSWEAFIIPACAVDAPHRRDRVWIVANAKIERLEGQCITGASSGQGKRIKAGGGSSRAPSKGASSHAIINGEGENAGLNKRMGWEPEPFSRISDDARTPRLCRTDDGIPNRLDRVAALGNAVVPQIPEIIGRAILRRLTEDKAIEIIADMNTARPI